MKNLKQISSSAEKIIEDHKNSNLFLEVLEKFKSEDEKIRIACCNSAGKILNHFVQSIDFFQTNTSKGKLSKDEQFHSWLKEQYKTTCDILYDLLNDANISVQVSAFEALILIASGLGEKNSTCCMSESNQMLQKIMPLLLSCEHDRGILIPYLSAFLNACGNKEEMVMIFLKCIRQNLNNEENKLKTNDTKAFNVWHTLTHIAAEAELDEKAKGMLNKIVLNFLKQEVPLKLYKEILTGISSVMEKMTQPLLLADFLSQSFSVGGAISLMSLNGLFTLMHKYNLNYPDFYEKLYSLFQPQIFGARYRARFFHLADVFLSSTHLPSYVIAAFVKKLARLTLHAPASGIRIAVPFIFNLIKKHPACDVLFHRTDGDMKFDSDPFLENESISNCNALESCVWELRTLEHHFNPTISNKAKKRQIEEEELSNLLDESITEIMESEAKKQKKDVALTFEKFTDFCVFKKFII